MPKIGSPLAHGRIEQLSRTAALSLQMTFAIGRRSQLADNSTLLILHREAVACRLLAQAAAGEAGDAAYHAGQALLSTPPTTITVVAALISYALQEREYADSLMFDTEDEPYTLLGTLGGRALGACACALSRVCCNRSG